MTGTPNVTPNEIRNAKFSTSLRGIKRSEVEELLNLAADALEDALSIAAGYQERYHHLQEKHEKLASMERTLKTTLLEAKKSASSLIESAKADAEDIITAAGDKQLAIEDRARERVDQMQARIEKLDQLRADYKNNLSSVIEKHLKAIEEMQVQSPEIGASEEVFSDIKEENIDNIVEYETGEPTDTEKSADRNEIPKPKEAIRCDKMDDEVTQTWKTIQETDTDGPAIAATLADAKSSADLFDESELDTYESDSQSGPPETESRSEKAEKDQETVAERIARAVRSARSAAGVPSVLSEITPDHAAPVKTDFLDEDTLYKKLACEHESEREAARSVSENETTKSGADSHKREAVPVLPGPGPDGILVFGRKEDRDRSLEENVKVLQELDSVIDKFAEELEDVQRK